MSENPKAQALGFFILLGSVNRQNMNPSCLWAFVDVVIKLAVHPEALTGMTHEHYRRYPSVLPCAGIILENGRETCRRHNDYLDLITAASGF